MLLENIYFALAYNCWSPLFYMFNCLSFVLLILVELLTSLFKTSFHNVKGGLLVVMYIKW